MGYFEDKPLGFQTHKRYLLDSVVQILDNNICTDYVHIDDNEEESLINIWKQSAKTIKVGDREGHFCPADLIFQGTIPIPDLMFIHKSDNLEVKYRIHIFNNYDECLSILEERGSTGVGVIEQEMVGESGMIHYVFLLFISTKYPDVIYPAFMGCKEYDYVTERTEQNETIMSCLMSLSKQALSIWYAVQVCLLNPVTEIIFANPTKVKLHGKDKVKAQKTDHTIKYIKHYYVKGEDVDNALYGGDRSYNRKCLIWYVTGHWRTYKDGKKTFIKGYFKGALRNTPTEAATRKRDLVINEELIS